MKCNICGKTKAKRTCRIEGIEAVCSKCCGISRNWSICNTECYYFPEETVNALPNGEVELTRVYDGNTNKFVKDCFLPNVYDSIVCDIEQFLISILETNRIEFSIKFKFISKRNIGNEGYNKDSWKLAEVGAEGNDKIKVPLLIVFSKDTGESVLIDNCYHIDDLSVECHKSSSHMNIWLPFSKVAMENVDASNLPEFQGAKQISARVASGTYFVGKNDIYWGEFVLNKTYSFNIAVFYEKLQIDKDNKSIYLPFGIFSPFNFVNIYEHKVFTRKSISLHKKSNVELLLPITGKMEQIFLCPLDGNEDALEYSQKLNIPMNELENEFHYDRYCIMYYNLKLNVNEGISIAAKFSNFPIASGIYNSMNELYDGKFSPVKVFITNTTNCIRTYKIVCDIDEFSSRFSKNVHCKPFEHLIISVSPTLLYEKVNGTTEITECSISIKVYEDSNVIYEESNLIKIFPRETFVWHIEGHGNAWKVYLSQMLARWVTPHITEIDCIIAEAARRTNHIQGVLSNDFNEILAEMQAIYDIISLDIRYVSRSFSYSTVEYDFTQRISLPKTTLKLKSGNCIDLSILLGSCFEARKLPVVIALIPGHAFVGVDLGNSKIFLESTYLGNYSFRDAYNKGMNTYRTYFDENGNSNMNDAKLVYINLSRSHGILPME